MNAYHAKKREEMEARLEDATFLMTDGGCTLEQAAERVGVKADVEAEPGAEEDGSRMTTSQYKQTKIPQSRRDQVQERDKMRCCRCGVPAPTGQWHHRRSRSVVELHRHCSCNGVWLCRTCHMDVHKNPERSMDEGFIVRRSVLEPATVPLYTTWGTRSLDCKGAYTYLSDDVPTVGMPRGATNE